MITAGIALLLHWAGYAVVGLIGNYWIAAATSALILAILVNALTKSRRKSDERLDHWFPWLLAGAGLSLATVAIALQKAAVSLSSDWCAPWILIVLSALVVLLLFFAIHFGENLIEEVAPHIRSMQPADKAKPHCLLLPVSRETNNSNSNISSSRTNRKLTFGEDQWRFADQLLDTSQGLSRVLASMENERGDELAEWTWLQNLRAIMHHQETLKQIWLIGSKESDGSFRELGRLKAFLQACLPEGIQIYIGHPKHTGEDVSNQFGEDFSVPHNLRDSAFDFFDFEGYQTSLRGLVNSVAKNDESHNAVSYDKIVIDITSGPKSAGIAASNVTLTSRILIQYVDGKGVVNVYDIQNDRNTSLG